MMEKNNKISTKNKIIIAVSAILLTLVFASLTFLSINLFNNYLAKQKTETEKIEKATIKASADKLKTQAFNTTTSKSKALLEQAKKLYKKINDINNIVDIDSRLYTINNGPGPTPEVPVFVNIE